MKLYNNPSTSQAEEIPARPAQSYTELLPLVEEIFKEVKMNGDEALLSYTQKFDNISLSSLQVSETELKAAGQQIPPSLRDAIAQAAANIRIFHQAQITENPIIETSPGVTCWQKTVPISSVGLYIPGGTAPLFSTALMLAIPASIAGCENVICCTPPGKDGKIPPAILYACFISGVKKVYACGGIQAIAGMVYGSASLPKVDKIFGPGNAFVTAAKMKARDLGIPIDLPAGPSEVMVVADVGADPRFIAADLLSQAEHGVDSQVICVTTNENIAKQVKQEIQIQLKTLPRKDISRQALENSKLLMVSSQDEMLFWINEYAPEHLILMVKDEAFFLDNVKNAGSVFVGDSTPESAGDYASGTNHTLPTQGFAKAYSGLTLSSFTKTITYQRISKAGLQKLGPIIEIMAEAEELIGHKRAVSIRLEAMKNNTEDLGGLGTELPSNLLRPHLLNYKPYSSARMESTSITGIKLDANENPFPSGYNRYPDPAQNKVKEKISLLKKIPQDQVFLGNGSDEVIDLLIRAYCEPQKDSIIILPPTYGMYAKTAQLNNVEIIEAPLLPGFIPDTQNIIQKLNPNVKLTFFCSPNNPTGNIIDPKVIEKILQNSNGIVVVDEAYIDFSPTHTIQNLLSEYSNLVILQTLSKAWGLAGIRLGICLASTEIISALNRIKPPYNVSDPTQEIALKRLSNPTFMQQEVERIFDLKKKLILALEKTKGVQKIFPSAANFLLVKFNNPNAVYQYLSQKKIIVRNRSSQHLCEGCLRITVGTEEENQEIILGLQDFFGIRST